MYFLVCKNCGHRHKVVSETLLFCENCNKKLDNNYRDWKNRKPEKTFEDFKLAMCIPETEIQVRKTTKNTGIGIIGIMILVLVLVLSGVAGYHYRGKIMDYIMYGHPLRFSVEQTWNVEDYGLNGLKVETPFTLKSEILTFPDEVKAEIENCSSYSYWTSANFYTSILSIRYIQQVEAMISLRSTSNDAMNRLKQLPGVSDFNYKEDRIYYKNIPGYKQTGTLIKDKTQLDFISVGYLDSVNLYQVLVVFETDDSVARKVAERIIHSIKIENIK